MRFASFLSGGFITAIVVNPPERKLAKRTSVQCAGGGDIPLLPWFRQPLPLKKLSLRRPLRPRASPEQFHAGEV